MDPQQQSHAARTSAEAAKLTSAAHAARAAGHFQEAVDLQQEALRRELTAHDPCSPTIAARHHQLGLACHEARQLEAAGRALETALRIRERQRGGAEDVVRVREALARLREAEGRFGEARRVRVEEEGAMGCSYLWVSWMPCLPTYIHRHLHSYIGTYLVWEDPC